MERQKLSKTFTKSFRKTVYFFYLLVVFTNPLVYLSYCRWILYQLSYQGSPLLYILSCLMKGQLRETDSTVKFLHLHPLDGQPHSHPLDGKPQSHSLDGQPQGPCN